jgi:uncharacterized phiE125 gp8 family phage protein
MSLFITSAGSELVTIDEAREWCRVLNEDHDTILTALISSAREHVEKQTGRNLVDKTIVKRMDHFPCSRVIQLSGVPLREVTSITYLDANGDSQTLSSDLYEVDIYGVPGRIVLNYDDSWPVTDIAPNAVTVTYKSGYTGAGSYLLPPTLREATRFLIAHWFANREPSIVGVSIADIPKTFDALIAPWVVFE